MESSKFLHASVEVFSIEAVLQLNWFIIKALDHLVNDPKSLIENNVFAPMCARMNIASNHTYCLEIRTLRLFTLVATARYRQ